MVASAGRLGLAAAAVAGAALAGATAGVAAERALVRRAFRSLEDEPEPMGTLRGTPVAVTTDDGVRLYAEVDEPDDPALADLTVVFSHGYALNMDCWHFQRRDLRGSARLVFWDQRSHGRSGRGAAESHTIDQLGRDLLRVIEACAPRGPLVLVGHSMGGMTVMGLAAERPDLFGDPVRAVGLIATSAGEMAAVTFRMPPPASRLLHRRAQAVSTYLIEHSEALDRGRARTTDLSFLLTKRLSFGGPVSPGQVQFVADLLGSTPMQVLAEFLPEFDRHDKATALAALNHIETLVLVGDSDALTPASHSREIVRHIPGARLVVVPATGHMIITERPQQVSGHLRDLIADVRAGQA